ncbi:hypothetical protein [Rhodococcus sp. KRD162]|jgi:hypothetical protein|uniref:hypothetical protein n=1 Tax=Rhodococcus sp. KRD162 TaxID=2729725 RepID=UPI0019D0DAC8|nr:hypothetical protein [Rhodococcus sp. KRD162]
MAHNFFEDPNFARVAAEQAATIDMNGIRDAVMQNVTSFDTTSLQEAARNASAFNTVNLLNWQSPANGVMARIAEQLTSPAFDQMQNLARDLDTPWLDSISASLSPVGDTAWLAPYLQTVDSVTLFDTVFSAQSPIVDLVGRMSDGVRDQFVISPILTDTLISSQFTTMLDSIDDLVTPSLMNQFRDTVLAPNIGSILDNIAEAADHDLIDEIEDFLADVSDEQEAFVADLIDANPSLKMKFQGAVASVGGKITTTVSERRLRAGLALFAVTGIIHTVLLVAPEEFRDQAMQFATIAALVYGVFVFHENR